MSKKKFAGDAMLNIIAYALPIVILQLVALPVVGSRLGEDQYGLVITLISLFTLLSLPFGNVLNNIRLLENKQYELKKLSGDFNVILVGCTVISSFLTLVGSLYYSENTSFYNALIIMVISALNLVREYLVVSFRINLNYKAILLNNVILGIGYLVGLLLFIITGYWHWIFIVGSILSLFYIIMKTNLIKENFEITSLFRQTTYKTFILFVSTFLKTILSYADKLILFPLLGPGAVSIYYTATIVGKIVSMAITPINSVMLSYLTRIDRISIRKFIYILTFTTIIGVVGYFITILLSYPLLTFLYPDWAKESLKLIYITTATVIVGVVNSVIHPFILRYNSINWQLVISGVNVIIYIASTYTFYNQYGLIGFCIGILIANVIKLLLMIAVFIFSYIVVNKKQLENEAL